MSSLSLLSLWFGESYVSFHMFSRGRFFSFLIGWTKTKEEETKWYFFGAKRYYFKINRQEGTAVCIGVDNPKLFANSLTKIMPNIASNLLKEIEKEAKKMKAKEPKTPEEFYEKLLYIYTNIYGGGKRVLELKIKSFMKQGLSREESIRKLAEKEKLILQS